LGRIGVVAVEEPCARAGGVEQRDLRCGVGVQGLRIMFEGGRGGRVDFHVSGV